MEEQWAKPGLSKQFVFFVVHALVFFILVVAVPQTMEQAVDGVEEEFVYCGMRGVCRLALCFIETNGEIGVDYFCIKACVAFWDELMCEIKGEDIGCAFDSGKLQMVFAHALVIDNTHTKIARIGNQCEHAMNEQFQLIVLGLAE